MKSINLNGFLIIKQHSAALNYYYKLDNKYLILMSSE